MPERIRPLDKKTQSSSRKTCPLPSGCFCDGPVKVLPLGHPIPCRSAADLAVGKHFSSISNRPESLDKPGRFAF